MGYAVVFGACVACGVSFQFNPHKVPSLRVNGSRQPLCRMCAERWCELHPEAPRPNFERAYDPIPEEDL